MARERDQFMDPDAAAWVLGRKALTWCIRMWNARTADDFLAKFDLPRRSAESRVQMGGSLPVAFVSVLGPENASLPRAYKSPVLASAQASLGIAGAIRRVQSKSPLGDGDFDA